MADTEVTLKEAKSTVAKPYLSAWSITALPISFFVFFAGQLIGVIPIYLFSMSSGRGIEATGSWLDSSTVAQFFMIASVEIVTVVLLYGFMKVLRVTPKLIGLIKLKLKDIWYALAGYAVYFILYLLVVVAAKLLLPSLNFDQEQELGFNTAISGLALVPVFLSLVVLPPVVEEILCRGFLYTGLKNKIKPIAATIITSVVFATAHLQWGAGAPLLWVAAIDTFVLSLVLCFLRERTRGLAAPIMLHAIKNGVAFSALFIFKVV